MFEPGATVIGERPSAGRTLTTSRRVRLGDVGPDGMCRLDAMARYVQDLARDDSADSGLSDPMNWVVRRSMIEVERNPVFQEKLQLTTWCSGFGGRWAERRTEIRGESGASVEAVTLWVSVDPLTGKPTKLGDDFLEIYGEACGGRKVSARTRLPSRPPEDAHCSAWPLRHVDLDVLGHVNNAAQWATVEEVLDLAGLSRVGMRAELEHGAGVTRVGSVELCWVAGDGGVCSWLMADGVTGNAASVKPIG